MFLVEIDLAYMGYRYDWSIQNVMNLSKCNPAISNFVILCRYWRIGDRGSLGFMGRAAITKKNFFAKRHFFHTNSLISCHLTHVTFVTLTSPDYFNFQAFTCIY